MFCLLTFWTWGRNGRCCTYFHDSVVILSVRPMIQFTYTFHSVIYEKLIKCYSWLNETLRDSPMMVSKEDMWFIRNRAADNHYNKVEAIAWHPVGKCIIEKSGQRTSRKKQRIFFESSFVVLFCMSLGQQIENNFFFGLHLSDSRYVENNR